ncbi:CLT3 [Symbiodinium pilosum]|uniref:CLT3 protein n=1 Tax=Symbiodinium pilosum TaxID=2952 RepID=A0A812WSM1_SYMPI|nr:CLT3 [Symbiodinium pilosum]
MRHTYFLALTTTMAQLSIYCLWLWQKVRQGEITKSMWEFVRSHPWLLGAFGLCEGAFFPLVFYSAARLPGSLVQVLNQTLIPFTVLFSFVCLKRRYDSTQMLGVVVVLCGVTLFTSLPQSSGSPSVFLVLCIAAYGLQAAAMVVKETVFLRFSQLSKGQGKSSTRHPFDAALFLTIGTCCRCAVQLLAWPVYLQLVSPALGVRSSATAGIMAMMQSSVLPLTIFYIAANVAISITALLLVQMTSASTVVLANVVALPLSALLFCLPLPSLEREEKMLDNLLTPESGFYAALAPKTNLQLVHFAPPHIIQVLSDCPPIEKIEESDTRHAVALLGRKPRRSHLFQSQLGVEMLSRDLRKQVCRRPLCRGYAELLRETVRGCPEDAGHKGIVARVARAVDTTMASCLEAAPLEKNHVLVSGIDTGSPAEMRAVEAAVGRILANELQLPLFAFEERGQSLADIFDPFLGGPNVFAVTDSHLRAWSSAINQLKASQGISELTAGSFLIQVAAQLTPLSSGEPFDESVGRFDEADQEIPVKQKSFFAEQHNLQMLAIQPQWNEQGVDPARMRIRIIFEDIVSKDDPAAIIRIFPVALRDICMSLKPDDQLQWQFFPADTGLGALEPAGGETEVDPLDGVPVGFVCHTIAAGDDVQVLASGEVLEIEVLQPLLRNTQYVVLLPPRIVKAAMGSTAFPGALWEGWPNEEGQGNKEYTFTTGIPKASFARLSIAVSCSSEEECQRQRGPWEA